MKKPYKQNLKPIFQSEIRQRFSYDDGKLIWEMPPREIFKSDNSYKTWISKNVGKEAGWNLVCKSGTYRQVKVNYKCYLLHRCIWAFHNGDLEAGLQIDHINGNTEDNRIENLRAVSSLGNAKNSKIYVNNTSGHMGVSWYDYRKLWLARISHEGKEYA